MNDTLPNSPPEPTPQPEPGPRPWGMKVQSYCMLLHLSLLAGYVFPGLGFALPIVMWAVNNDIPQVDAHGRRALNWLFSLFIYTIVSLFLIVLVVGIVALPVLHLVFSILAAVKANEGTLWSYPLSIRFFKET